MMKTDASFTENRRGELVWMTSDRLSAFPELTHAFTSRYGGVSSGIFSSLNLGLSRGDSSENIIKNYDIICSALELDVKRLVFSKQIHSDIVRRASDRDCKNKLTDETNYVADGLITDVPGLPLIIFTADCIPVLLYAADTKAVGAVHAGWRGTVANIAGKCVQRMCLEYGGKPENIYAAIGAGIDMCCFETGAEVYDAVKTLNLTNDEDLARKNGNGKYHVDLKAVNAGLLVRAGLRAENISINRECTKCLCHKYWSHRATQGRRGAQAAIIALS